MILLIIYMFVTILSDVWPAFILPVILSFFIYYRFDLDNRLHEFIAALSFKPVIATLLWAVLWLILSNSSSIWLLALTMVPGAGLTVIIVAKYRKAVTTNNKVALLLIGLDVIRWVNAFITITHPMHGLYLGNELHNNSGYILGLLLPNLYAVIALVLCIAKKRMRRPV